MPNRIWVDVEDLFQYAVFNARPSGIQRIEFELCRSLALMPESRDRVGFVRHAAAENSFYAIPFAEVDALHARLTVAAFETSAESGDLLLVLGSPWFHPFYAELIAHTRDKWGLRVALLVYDIIPLLRPEWCDKNLVARFALWARGMLPLADTLLTISQASAHDIVRIADRLHLPLRAQPSPIPIGTGFSRPVGGPGDATGHEVARPVRTDRLPPPWSHVLLVSTIAASKNYVLLFRVWRRLLDERPPEQAPTLVFAGKVGWLVADLMQQLHNARCLDGKILLIENPQDGELELLYEGCLFTVFPSFYEGWGLPVTESLSFGRPCIISNASALPEAGGHLARYFDPENGDEAFRVILQAIQNLDETRAWGARVAADFRPVSWDESARAVLRLIDHGRSRGKLPDPGLPASNERVSDLPEPGPVLRNAALNLA